MLDVIQFGWQRILPQNIGKLLEVQSSGAVPQIASFSMCFSNFTGALPSITYDSSKDGCESVYTSEMKHICNGRTELLHQLKHATAIAERDHSLQLSLQVLYAGLYRKQL